MKLPFGPFVRAMGGIGIDRSVKQVGQERQAWFNPMSDLFKTHPKLVMLVTPEGTRSNRNSGKRVLPCRHDGRCTNCFSLYGLCQEKTGLEKLIYPTGNYEQDMAEIMAFYAEINAKHPEKFSVDQRYANNK